MNVKISSDKLFDNFYETLDQFLGEFEDIFGIEGIYQSFFGCEKHENDPDDYFEEHSEALVRALQSTPWNTLHRLYEYGVNGKIDHTVNASTIHSDADVLISYLRTSRANLSAHWDQILQMSMGRLSLDDGQPLSPQSIALLAGVDIRTVRNACSAGELINFKQPLTNELMVDNKSAKTWLSGRRGFIPTNHASTTTLSLSNIRNPSEFGLMIQERMSSLKKDSHHADFVFHDAWTTESLEALKSGKFNAPLDSLTHLSNFLEIEHKELLLCVMRVFYPEQLSMLIVR